MPTTPYPIIVYTEQMYKCSIDSCRMPLSASAVLSEAEQNEMVQF